MTRPYRPSNGTEGDCFMAQWCEHCVNDDPENDKHCDILTATMLYGEDDPEYPTAWVTDDQGPRCTAFSAEGTPEVDTETLPLFPKG